MMGPKSLAENIAERRARRAAAKEEAVIPDGVEVAGLCDEANLVVEVDESPQFTLDDLVVMVSNYHSSSETFDSLFASMNPLEAQKVLLVIHANLDRFSALGSEDTNLPSVVQELLRHDPRYTALVSSGLTEEQKLYLETVSLPESARCFLQLGKFERLIYKTESDHSSEEDIVIDLETDSSETNVNDGMPNAEALLDKQSELNASLTDGVVKAHGRLDEVEGAVAQLVTPVVIVTQEDIDARSSSDPDLLPVDMEGDPALNVGDPVAPNDVQPTLYDHADDPEFEAPPSVEDDSDMNVDVVVIVQEPHGCGPDAPPAPVLTPQEVVDVPFEFAVSYMASIDECLAALNSLDSDDLGS